MDDKKDVIAHNIKKYRKACKMTQKDLADKVGVSISAVSNWEKGNNTLTIDCLFDVCNALDVPISKMTEADDFVLSRVEREMILNFREASTLDQIQVLNILGVSTFPARLLPYAKLMKELNTRHESNQKDN
jgi:transcriptional regulator with XRE-family HTH domain